MGATFSIQTSTEAEFLALQSEGAPTVHATYSTGMGVLALVGVVVGAEDYWATIEADAVAEAAATLRAAAAAGDCSWAVAEVAAVCEAAGRLGRGVDWG